MYFYTHPSLQTLEKIITTIKIKQLRKKMIHHFFEYCLVSYLANENIDTLRDLRRGEPVSVSNVMIKTQNFFASERYKQQKRSIKESSTPDICLERGSSRIIIDAYDGTLQKEIKSKLDSYDKFFKDAKVFVFASGISAREMFEFRSNTFAFYCKIEEEVVHVEEITIGDLVINIKTINEQYFKAYRNFSKEFHYWCLCDESKEILTTKSR